MSTPVSSIRNLGPAVEAACKRAGIPDAETLRDMGPDAAYEALIRSGTPPHFIGYYCMVLGLQGRPWNDARGDEKLALRTRFDAIKARVQGDPKAAPKGIEAILDQIGVRPAK